MYAVIMAGGGGTRLWPLSRRDRPKPFLPLIDGGSLLQATVERLRPLIEARDVYVVTDGRYSDVVREQLLDVPAANVLAEPFGRNTAAAVALAAVAIERTGDDVMVVLPADHRISDAAGFRHALEAAAARAARGDLVTLGIEPTGPETGYGYIVANAQDAAADGGGAHHVERFEEKPTIERAKALLGTHRAYWNAGIFIWRRDAVLAGLRQHAPEIVEPLRAAVASGADLRDVYEELRAAPIDVALMEPASLDGRVAVVPTDVGWSDLGNWAALLDALAASANAGTNGVVALTGERGKHMDVGSHNILVGAQGGRLVATVGLGDVIVVDTPDALLVVSREAAQSVKQIVDRLIAEGREELL